MFILNVNVNNLKLVKRTGLLICLGYDCQSALAVMHSVSCPSMKI